MNDPAAEPTAVEYVDWLLKYMLRVSRLKTTIIDTRRALPGSEKAGADDGPPCLPSVERVLNRLKVLSGLSPVRYPQAVEAGFERPRATCTLVVATRFLDDANASTCAIRLRIRAKQA